MGKVDVVKGIPFEKSQDSEWIAWHKALKSEFGSGEAGRLWLARWKKQSSHEVANTSELRYYMSSQGINIQGNGIFSGFSDAYTQASHLFDGYGKVMGIVMICLGIVLFFVMYKIFVPAKSA